MARRKATVEPRHLLAVLVMGFVCFAAMGLILQAGKGAVVAGVVVVVVAAIATLVVILKRRRATAKRMQEVLDEPSSGA